MIAPGDLGLFRLTDDNDEVMAWLEQSFALQRQCQRDQRFIPR